MGSLYLWSEEYKSAEESLLRAVELNETNRSQIGLINSLGTLGALYVRILRYDLAEQASLRALDYITASSNRNSIQYQYGEAVATNNLGSIAAWQGKDADALRYFERTVDLYGQMDKEYGGYQPAVLDGMSSLGKVYYNIGDYRKALGYYSDVLMAAEKNGFRNVEQAVLSDMGLLYMDQADFETATQFFAKSLKLANEVGDRETEITATCNLGVANERQGKYEPAVQFFRGCLQQARRANMPKFDIPALEGLATVYRRKGQYKLALETYDNALQAATKSGDKLRQAELAWWKAGTYYDLAEYEQALRLSSRAGELAEEIHESNYSYLALTLSGKSRLALGQYEAARVSLQGAIEKVEQIRSRVGGQEQQRAFFFGRKTEPYYLMVDLLVRENRPEEALEFAEKARSRALLDLIGNAKFDIARNMSPAEKEEEQKLNGQLATLNTQLYRAYQQNEPDVRRIDSLKAHLETARLDYDSFMDRLFVMHPEMRADRGQAAPFSIGDAKFVLGSPDASVVEFEVLENKVYVFILTLGDKGEVRVNAYPVVVSKKAMTGTIQQFRDQITNNSLGIEKPSSEIFQLLLGSAAPVIKNKKTLIFVPDDVLWDLPFQALKDGDGHYLIEDHAVFYAPSLTALREMKQRQLAGPATVGAPAADDKPGPDPALTLLAFGNPALSSTTVAHVRAIERNVRLGPLPAAKREVETLGTLYGASRSEVFVGSQASEDKAKAEMARFRILHFATHGIMDGTNPLYSHIVLSQTTTDSTEDGLLEAREIMNMNLNADIAVLSACETARGRISSGEGVIGMSWAFFVAGCPTTVVSQWSVESNSTAKLMIDFHRALLSLNKNSDHVRGSAEALRQAALTMLHTPGYDHPLFWAGFIVIGNGW